MLRIRRVHDDFLPSNKSAIAQAQQILRERIPAITEADLEGILLNLNDPHQAQLAAMLWVAEDGRGRVKGMAHILYAPDVALVWLDWISVARGAPGGLGGALYERVRAVALHLGVPGIFLECLSDEPALCADKTMRVENGKRLKFYERYGARPIINTAWETPLPSGDETPPHLVFDGLGQEKPLRLKAARQIARDLGA